MRRGSYSRLAVYFGMFASLGFGQVGNGSITGTVTDPAGAIVPVAAVEAKNIETGVVFSATSTNTGNYTISNLPIGSYSVTLKVQGFKTYVHTNLAIAATQVLREDVTLQVGNATEAVTVTAEGTLLTTETAELTHNITLQQLDGLPLLGIGTANSGSSGLRNPYNVMQTLPGMSNYTANSAMILNGLGGVNAPTETMRIEGQDMTNYLVRYAVQENQPSADAIQEVAIQVSNYAPEFGTAGAAVLNITMKSGTNQYHGSGYDYFVNEDLNAGSPFSISTTGQGKYRPRNRRQDFGGTVGGPIYIPKVYNGRNKSFFFWNYEEYVESQQYAFNDTVPTPDYLAGNFSKISPNGNCSLCAQQGIQTTALGIPTPQLDALGRQLFANTIYDPASRGVNPTNNLGFANPFLNNVIPATRFDPVTIKMEALFPAAQNANLLANYLGAIQGQRFSTIPSIKIDHNLDDKDKLSFYYSKTSTESQIASPNGNADGLPTEIGGYRGTFIYTAVYRLNYDRTLKSNLLLHLGAGWYHQNFGDAAPFLSFDPNAFGLNGFIQHRQFPSVVGMCVIPLGATSCTGAGGMQNIGTAGQGQTLNIQEKPTFNANATWIRGSHSYKLGAEAYLQGIISGTFSGVTLTTSTAPTSQPFTATNSLNGFGTGFGYASWLLGDYASTRQTAALNYRNGQGQYALFLQDSWKVTRKLTLDYGLRWDLSTVAKETYGRLGQFDISAPNANAGGHPGATQYANTCNCNFYQPAYPFAIGPRIGVAYQVNPKTVVRAGWGIVYQPATANAGSTVSTTATNAPPGINSFVNIETPGAILQPIWPVTDPSIYPALGTTTGAPTMPDANQNRPPRLNQFSVGVQREFTRNFVVEASYVANRVAWLGGSLGFLSQISPATYAQYGLYPYPGTGPAGYNYAPAGISCVPGNDCDRALLGQAISSTAVIQKLKAAGVNNGLLPYAGYPTSNSLSSVLRPFPQFPGAAGTGIGPSGSATGNSKYDSLQVKVTKRLSHRLQVGASYTWAKGFTREIPATTGRQDFWNPATEVNLRQAIPPQVLAINFLYTTPKFEFLDRLKIANLIVKDWALGGFMDYQSGAFLTVPTSPTSNFLASQDIRVPGQPLYLKDVNDKHNLNPYTDIVLNPAAWAVCPSNTTCGTGTTYNDFRGPRHPSESFNIGRNFRIKERMNFQIRGEFTNIFNRTQLPNPSAGSPQNAPVKNSLGIYTSGFGTMAAYSVPGVATFTGRTGTVVGRFTF
jgi:hypothetical protein